MMKKEVTIKFVNGVEASPIALLVQTANRFSSSIYIESGDKKVNVKSIMGMMSLAMNYEDMVTVVTEGEERCLPPVQPMAITSWLFPSVM